MAVKNRSVIGALDAIRDAILSAGISGEVHFPQAANGPVEQVLVFGTSKLNVLKNPPPATGTHFSATGFLTDVQGRRLPGSKVVSAYALAVPPPDKLPAFLKFLSSFPPPQPEPFDDLAVVATDANPPSPAKEHYDFGDGNSLTVVGFSLPKVVRLKGGGGQFSVSNASAVTQGTGIYEGASGLASYAGSSYFPAWPEEAEDLFALLAEGIEVKATVSVRLVLKGQQAPPPSPPSPPAGAKKQAPPRPGGAKKQG